MSQFYFDTAINMVGTEALNYYNASLISSLSKSKK